MIFALFALSHFIRTVNIVNCIFYFKEVVNIFVVFRYIMFEIWESFEKYVAKYLLHGSLLISGQVSLDQVLVYLCLEYTLQYRSIFYHIRVSVQTQYFEIIGRFNCRHGTSNWQLPWSYHNLVVGKDHVYHRELNIWNMFLYCSCSNE